MEGGQGGDGGAPESSVGATKVHWFPLFLKNLTTGLIWWGDGGRRGEVAHGGRARGEMGAGHQILGSLKNLTTGVGATFWAPLKT